MMKDVESNKTPARTMFSSSITVTPSPSRSAQGGLLIRRLWVRVPPPEPHRNPRSPGVSVYLRQVDNPSQDALRTRSGRGMGVLPAVDEFLLQHGEERFTRCVGPAHAGASHRLEHADRRYEEQLINHRHHQPRTPRLAMGRLRATPFQRPGRRRHCQASRCERRTDVAHQLPIG